MDHPWRRLRELGEWVLHWAELPVRGITDFAYRTITLDVHLLQAERRSVIAHELEHIRRGPFPAWDRHREEEHVSREAARRLICVQALGEALAWSHDPHEIADELWVDVPTLEARMRGLRDSERAYLQRRLEHPEHGND